MAGASGGSLAAQVTLGGGFGFLGAGYETIEKHRSELSIARSILKVDAQAPLPIGVGYLGWLLDDPKNKGQELLSIALENRVQAIWLSFGNDLEKWIQLIRNTESNREVKEKTKIFIVVSSVQEALVAANKWKADVIVAQGTEAGGHGSTSRTPLLTLVSSILAAIPQDCPPIVAAGGLVNGGHLASLLTLGASGAVFGTRFLLSPESQYTDVQRQALITASTSDSVRTMAFDYARNTLGWPRGIDGRGLHNSTVEDFEKGVDVDVVRSRYHEGAKRNDPDRIVIWAGAGVGMMDKIQPAKEIVEEIHRECTEILRAAATLLSEE
ncbi:2-nitropropane dioxygenase [Collybia nuda]|uniref:2-nitropropane dioxygenase n=1 Tax=Collybia nuda TaxID=64659 RepID=A0A9P6C9C6_9AGAR|nr:2-nitropropane dioxygenase [Collybia nuda]